MSDSNRLARLKRARAWIESGDKQYYATEKSDYEWLIRRVEELERDNEIYRKIVGNLVDKEEE